MKTFNHLEVKDDFQKIILDLQILHDNCQTSARIYDLHIVDFLVRYVHCSLGYYLYSGPRYLFGKLPDSFVDFLGSNGSRLLHDVWIHRSHTKKPFHSSCCIGNPSSCGLHAPDKYDRNILFEQNGRLVSLCPINNYPWYGRL